MKSDDDEDVTIRFVLPQGKNETTCSENLSSAFELAQEVELHPNWIRHDDVLNLVPTKTDVFVMDPFEGKAFEMVSKCKSTLVGPRCLITCLKKNEPVPELPYPMYSAAMKGLIITSTGFDKIKKNEIQSLVEQMAGIYTNAFHDGVTHLVAAVVRSQKYEVAVNKEIPVMTNEWVTQVWKRSSTDNIDAVDKMFSRYACPALMGLNICVSQMSQKDKELLKRSIESHGGIYAKNLDSETANVLIIPKAEGDKYLYATRWKIPTLSPNWIFDSIEKGHCLPTSSYIVEKTCSSTPQKDEISKLHEVSLCSTILAPGDLTLTKQVNETTTTPTFLSKKKNVRTKDDFESESNESFISFQFEKFKKTDESLKNVHIYLCGFPDVNETLKKVINNAGGSVSQTLNSRVTHVIIKKFAKNPVNECGNVHRVSLSWLMESLRLGRPAPESDFPPKLLPSRFSQEPLLEAEEDIMAHYSKTSQNEKTIMNNDVTKNDNEATQDYEESVSNENVRFMNGKSFILRNLDSEINVELSEWIHELGGTLTSDVTMADYTILPSYGTMDNLREFEKTEILNNLWVDDCLDNNSLVNVEYYHRPLHIDRSLKALLGIVIGISGYTRRERQFIAEIATALGMVAQDVFAKRDKDESKKSTHLISNQKHGSKYDAALKWGLPVVDKNWILSCAQHNTWISEKPFLLDDSCVYTPGKPFPSSLNNTPPNCRKNTGVFQTPGLDEIEKLRPSRLEMTPSEPWRGPPESQPTPKRISQKENLPFQLSLIKTPNTPYGAFLGNDNPSPKTRKFWKSQCNQLKRQNTENEKSVVSKKLRNEHPIHSWSQHIEEEFNPDKIRAEREAALDDLTARGIPILERSKGRSFDDLMEDKLQKVGKSWKNPQKRIKLDRGRVLTLFKNVVVFITKKHSGLHEKLTSIINDLGGEVVENYSSTKVTHVIFSGKTNDITKEFRTARADGKKIVCPEWIYMCHEEKCIVDESAFPHTYNHLRVSCDETKVANISENLAKMDEIMNYDKNSSNANATRNEMAKSIRMSLVAEEGTPNRMEAQDKSDFDTQSTMNDNAIQWIDPIEADEEEKLAAKLNYKSQRLSNDMTQDLSGLTDIPLNFTEMMAVPEQQSNRKKVFFIFSGFGDREETKKEFVSFLENSSNSNISFSNTSGYHEETTHVIAVKLNRSEKILCAIASGVWLLHPSYITECLKAKKLVPEDDFEWGNEEKNFFSNEELLTEELKLQKTQSIAAKKWRLHRLSNHGQLPFYKMTAIVHTSSRRREAFVRLLESGGGSVSLSEPPYEMDSESTTHCFAEPKRIPNVPINYSSLAQTSIPVVDPIYLSNYLLQDPPPPPEQFIISPYKSSWNNRKTFT